MENKNQKSQNNKGLNNINNSDFGTNTKHNYKTAVDNEWISTEILPFDDNRERRDGPGGEDAR